MTWRYISVLIACLFLCLKVHSQADGQWGVCEFATVSDMNAFDPSSENWDCKKAFIQASSEHYYWDGSAWVKLVTNTVFYPPSIAIDVSTLGVGSLDLHQEYLNRFGSPAVSSTDAPTSIPTYGETELYYYVTDYDNAVFANISITADGIMSYEVIAASSTCSILNIVFVVK